MWEEENEVREGRKCNEAHRGGVPSLVARHLGQSSAPSPPVCRASGLQTVSVVVVLSRNGCPVSSQTRYITGATGRAPSTKVIILKSEGEPEALEVGKGEFRRSIEVR